MMIEHQIALDNKVQKEDYCLDTAAGFSFRFYDMRSFVYLSI